ncbi:hypothetical protein IFM89_012464 [Coptis chinensis]|uniref:Uncharacterized protein n=1 Tax=Coptis chinensis TaxID=261450 RepID=A0A835LZP7_9MAGN|nr:hypothetical protein IFM89_012464 [Coptis chinensis]
MLLVVLHSGDNHKYSTDIRHSRLEWDRSDALSDFILMRPSGTPRAVLALRGTLLKSPTIRRDIEDDLRFTAWESLKSYVRFSLTLEALKLIVEKYGSTNVCIQDIH